MSDAEDTGVPGGGKMGGLKTEKFNVKDFDFILIPSKNSSGGSFDV